MAKINVLSSKTSNPARPPWHLQGKEAFIAKLREEDRLTFDEIGFRVGCSGEGARQAYVRHLKNRKPPAADTDTGAVSVGTDNREVTPEAEGIGITEGVE